MGESIDPDKLRSLSELAKACGYSSDHLARLAASGRLQAWRFGKTWVSTKDIVQKYVRTAKKPGRPKASTKKKKTSS